MRTWLRRACAGLGVRLVLGRGEESGPENAQCLLLVLELALLVLAADHDAGRHVGDPHRRVGGVDALTAGTAAAEDVDAQVVLVDLDLDGLGLGHHQDPGGARVDAALRLGDRHPLHPVDAALELQQRRTARGRARPCPWPSPPWSPTCSRRDRTRWRRGSRSTSRGVSAYRVYIRSRSPANSADSSPPSPDLISRRASLSSTGSRGASRRRSRVLGRLAWVAMASTSPANVGSSAASSRAAARSSAVPLPLAPGRDDRASARRTAG